MAATGSALSPKEAANTAEGRRLEEARSGVPWWRWGPYVSDRQWGTVREDYSADGDPWSYFPFDHARSRAYRWGEDGLAGFGDERLYVCLGLALWNGRDPILKERLFGLNNAEGNHGEDVKELYYHLDGVPTHSYMRMLYKYPQAAFPYDLLATENRRRGLDDPEFEIVDTGVFDGDRYFDVEIEYAKGGVNDVLMQVTVRNRSAATAELHVLPQLWMRNIWSWTAIDRMPRLAGLSEAEVSVEHPDLGSLTLLCEGRPELLFCDNDTNRQRLFDKPSPGYCKDGINDFVVNGEAQAVNPARCGTKVAAWYRLSLPAAGETQLRVRLGAEGGRLDDFAAVMRCRRAEADEFYEALQSRIEDPQARLVQRRAFAGMLWSKQFYHLEMRTWLCGDPLQPPPPEARLHGRNVDWRHIDNADIISMPDKWEYPWYAAWDLGFHCVCLAAIDPEFAKRQLILLTREWYMHPNGQLPAYEWKFGDVNPPVHAWAAWRVYEIDREARGVGDREFLERVFHKLIINFTWWVNRKDPEGRNIFQGGFLGLDNIGLFDRSAPLPTGGYINQSDGTAWMAMYTLNLMRIALELATADDVYEDIATKFFEHFLLIAEAMTNMGGDGIGLWDETDEFYYDALHLPNGERVPLRIRSLVGLIPLFAVEVLDGRVIAQLPQFAGRMRWFLAHRPELAALVSRWQEPNDDELHLLSLLRGHRMKRLLRRMLDESEFLSDFGVRSLSKYHERNPFVFENAGQRFSMGYVPGDSNSRLFGGNSNWRGPIWIPVNFLIIESLHRFHAYYGDDFRVEYPTGSGAMLTLEQIADALADRLTRLFLPDGSGHRPVCGDAAAYGKPEFREQVLFYEYFNGDTGRGLGASHQTGWTGLVALLLGARASAASDEVLPAPGEMLEDAAAAGGK
ncbi:MAG: glucosidase [Alphaproteobacteria bacterium]|nr:glucosidase [Alphaproteobacteria bacterium]